VAPEVLVGTEMVVGGSMVIIGGCGRLVPGRRDVILNGRDTERQGSTS
jgi:hypothetical protein